MKRLAKLFITLLSLVGLGAVVFLLGMRRKNPLLVDAVRRFTKEVVNPQQMESAGQPGAYAAVIEHKGRKSGKAYRTPIGVSPHGDDFITMLPYGRRSDWLQNILAVGSATILFEGESYSVDRLEVVPLNAARLDDKDRKLARLFGVSECLKMHKVSA